MTAHEIASMTETAATAAAPEISVVVPMHNEEGAVAGLIAGIAAAGRALTSFEIVAVDDGSTDGTLARLRAARRTVPELRILHHPAAGGQSAAVHSGVRAARSAFCCTLDGDGQNPPEELPKLWNTLFEEDGVGLVAGQRVGRKDTAAKRAASVAANAIRRRVLRDGTRDTGCGFKAFRRDAFLALPYFDHMHRYLPALFAAQGWPIALVDVGHAPRTTGRSKYTNLGRAVAGAWDLLGVVWLMRRTKTVVPTEIRHDD